MKKEELEILLTKYFDDSLSKEEKSRLIDWAQNYPVDFREAVRIQYYLKVNFHQKEYKFETIFSDFLEMRKNAPKVVPIRKKKSMVSWLGYAAMIVVIFSLGYYSFQPGSFNYKTSPTFTKQDPSKIILTLEDGTTQEIDIDSTQNIFSSTGNIISIQQKDKLVYKNKRKTYSPTYHTVSVPNGKRFRLTLEDGTQIVLNSGTTLRYPTSFPESGSREVFLETGEALFEVVTKDKTSPFFVYHLDQKIHVLGTVFNVNAYGENETVKTVLVEGALAVYQKDQKKSIEMLSELPILRPGELADWDKTTHKVVFKKAVIADHISWVEGGLVFVDEPFRKIIKRLERNFGVTIENKYQVLNEKKFSAKFKDETLEEILATVQQYIDFRYSIAGKKIVINPLKKEPMK